jgi:hypothetical protein
MSPKGVECLDETEDADGVGSASSGAMLARETLLCRAARASFTLRLLGAALAGDVGSSATLSGGLAICDASISVSVGSAAAAFVRLDGNFLPAAAVVLRFGDAFGAGANSSSSSSSASTVCLLVVVVSLSEPSSSSTMTFRRVAARRDDRMGNSEDISGGLGDFRQ